MKNEKSYTQNDIEGFSQAILMRLLVIDETEIKIEKFSSESNIPKEHMGIAIPYLIKNKFIENSTKLTLTEKGISRAKELRMNGINLIGEVVDNSNVEISSVENAGAIFSGNRITNQSHVNINIESEGQFTNNEIKSSNANINLSNKVKKSKLVAILAWLIPVLIALGILLFAYLNYQN